MAVVVRRRTCFGYKNYSIILSDCFGSTAKNRALNRNILLKGNLLSPEPKNANLSNPKFQLDTKNPQTLTSEGLRFYFLKNWVFKVFSPMLPVGIWAYRKISFCSHIPKIVKAYFQFWIDFQIIYITLQLTWIILYIMEHIMDKECFKQENFVLYFTSSILLFYKNIRS